MVPLSMPSHRSYCGEENIPSVFDAIISALEDEDLLGLKDIVDSVYVNPNEWIGDSGVSLMHLSIGHGSEAFAASAVELFMNCGGDANTQSIDGLTPVHVAATWNRPRVLRILLKNGGDPWLQDSENLNAFNHAFQEKAWLSVQILESFKTHKVPERKTPDAGVKLDPVKVSLVNRVDGHDSVEVPHNKTYVKLNGDKAPSVNKSEGHDSVEAPLDKTYVKQCVTTFEGFSPSRLKIVEITLDESKQLSLSSINDSSIEISNIELSSELNVDEEPSAVEKSQVLATVPEKLPQSPNTVASNKEITLDESKQLSLSSIDDSSIEISNIELSSEINVDEEPSAVKKSHPQSPYKVASNEEIASIKLNVDTLAEPRNNSQGTKAASPSAAKSSEVDRSDLFTELKKAVEERTKRISASPSIPVEVVRPKVDRNDLFSELKRAVEERAIRISAATEEVSVNTKNEVETVTEDVQLIDQRSSLGCEVINYTEIEKDSCIAALPPHQVNGKQNDSADSDVLYLSCASQEEITQENNMAVNRSQVLGADDLRAELMSYGLSPGPVTNTTYQVYLRLLDRVRAQTPSPYASPVSLQSGAYCPVLTSPQTNPLRSGPYSPVLTSPQTNSLRSGQYCPELTSALNNPLGDPPYPHLEEKMAAGFKNWPHPLRGGNARTSFNYLLLDSRVTQDLPNRARSLNKTEVLQLFLSAVFYIGKGQAARPLSHLQTASRMWFSGEHPPDPKVGHILDIWRSGVGVVLVQVFHNTTSAEALTREAAMLDALGRDHVTNLRRGEFYGPVAQWAGADRRRLGAHLLVKALRIFLQQGETSLRPTHV